MRCSENPGASKWPDRMKGGFEGRLAPALEGSAVWVLASTEAISANGEGDRRACEDALPNAAHQSFLTDPIVRVAPALRVRQQAIGQTFRWTASPGQNRGSQLRDSRCSRSNIR